MELLELQRQITGLLNKLVEGPGGTWINLYDPIRRHISISPLQGGKLFEKRMEPKSSKSRLVLF